jgi:hypothetical protein
MDLCAERLLIAEKMIDDGKLGQAVDARYAGWKGKMGRDILAGKMSLAKLAAHVEKNDLEPQPRSGGRSAWKAWSTATFDDGSRRERRWCEATSGRARAGSCFLGAAPAVHAKGELVGRLLVEFPGERWKKDEAAIKAALEAAGARYIAADAQGSNEKQLADVEALIAKGAKALIILAQDASAILPAVAKAKEAKVPVVAYDRLIQDRASSTSRSTTRRWAACRRVPCSR